MKGTTRWKINFWRLLFHNFILMCIYVYLHACMWVTTVPSEWAKRCLMPRNWTIVRYHVSTGNKTHPLQEQPGFLPAEPSLSSPKDMPLPLPKEQIIILLPVYWESEINTLLYRRVCRYFCKGKAVSILAVQSIYLPVFVTITQVWYWAQKKI